MDLAGTLLPEPKWTPFQTRGPYYVPHSFPCFLFSFSLSLFFCLFLFLCLFSFLVLFLFLFLRFCLLLFWFSFVFLSSSVF